MSDDQTAMLRSGAQLICEALIREGVRVIFGIPGGAIMPFYNALYDYRADLRHVLCRHEQGAGHAAEGYARASVSVGVCIGTSGPGATNLVTPIANAFMDSTPLVVITGQVSSALLGTDAFQETDITGITIPITKHNFLVTRTTDIPRTIKAAFLIASTGRPGPVLVDITKDAQSAVCLPDWNAEMPLPGYNPGKSTDKSRFEEAAQLLSTARRPLILAGNGVILSGASSFLLQFAEYTGIPVITTLHALGAFPQQHALSLGMPGMHGWVHVNRAIQRCDVLLNIGSRFDDRVTGRASTFAPNARIIHVDIDPAELGKLVHTEIGVNADAGDALGELLRLVPRTEHNQWLDEIRAMQAMHQPRQQYSRREPNTALAPLDVFSAVDTLLLERGGARVVTDVGQHQMWAAQLLSWSLPRTHITSGGAGTMGYAIPAAMGVAIARPNEQVWAICGDGGFQMTSQELATISQEKLRNMRVVVVNNGHLGMVRQWQQLFEQRRYSETPLSSPDFVTLAKAYGWHALRATESCQLQGALQELWDHDGPVLLEVVVQQEANVFPIVPQGEGIETMLVAAPATALEEGE